MARTAAEWIASLGLVPHPEGGFYRETYRAAEMIAAPRLPARFGGARVCSTAIYFLLPGDQVSALHRIKSDEIWHFYAGSALTLTMIHGDGRLEARRVALRNRAGSSSSQWPPRTTCGYGLVARIQGSFAVSPANCW